MADTLENVEMEQLKLDTTDFGEGLNNNFGIQDTKVLASKELNDFLLSEKDLNNITRVNDDKKDEEEKPDNSKEDKSVDNSKEKQDLSKNQMAKKLLEETLFKDSEEDTDDNTNNNSDTDNTNNQKTQQSKQNPSESDQNDDVFSTLAKDLMKLGVFTKNSDDEDEENISIKDPQEFLERFRQEQKKGAVSILDNFLSQFGDDYRKAFDAIFVSGVSPKDYLSTFSRIESVKNLDLTQEDNQRMVLKEYYKSLKWDDAKIENKIDKLKDYGELEDEAKSYHEVLLNRELEKEESLIKEREEEERTKKLIKQNTAQEIQKTLQTKLKDKEIQGIPLTPKDAQELYNYMVNEPYKLQNGEVITEMDKDWMELKRPENIEKRMVLASLLKRKMDLSIIKKSAISKKSEDIFTATAKNAKKVETDINKNTRSFFI